MSSIFMKIFSCYKELTKQYKIILVLCIITIIMLLASKFTLFKELYVNYMPDNVKGIIDSVISSLRWTDISIILLLVIIVVILLTSRKKMNLEEIRIQYKPVIDSENEYYQDISIDWLFIENDGEREFLQDLDSGQEIEYGKKYTNNRVLIDCLLGTKLNEYIITKLKIRWRYLHGVQCALSTCHALEPVLTWHVQIEIDTYDDSIREKIVDLEPALYIRPDESYEGVGNFNIELQYILTNIEYHPCADWDILYSITLIDHKGKEYELIHNRNWRNIPANQIML